VEIKLTHDKSILLSFIQSLRLLNWRSEIGNW